MIVPASVIGVLALAFVGHHPEPLPATPPRVVAVSPEVGAEVRAGKILLKVTFDQPMRPDGFSYIARDKQSFPACALPPAVSADGRTFTATCVVQAGRDYEVGFNNGLYRNFTSLNGVPAVPAVVRFSAH